MVYVIWYSKLCFQYVTLAKIINTGFTHQQLSLNYLEVAIIQCLPTFFDFFHHLPRLLCFRYSNVGEVFDLSSLYNSNYSISKAPNLLSLSIDLCKISFSFQPLYDLKELSLTFASSFELSDVDIFAPFTRLEVFSLRVYNHSLDRSLVLPPVYSS
ncbi:hypothetical protein RCL1_007329 [Eukaryota sp. TZLM3-RCL]